MVALLPQMKLPRVALCLCLLIPGTTIIPAALADLPAPTLSNPANGSSGQSTTPTFSWSPVNGATSYRIMVATNAADLPTDPAASAGGASVVINGTSATTSYTNST